MHAYCNQVCDDNGDVVSTHESHWKAVEAMLATLTTRDGSRIKSYGLCGPYTYVTIVDGFGPVTFYEPAFHREVMQKMKVL